MLISDRKSFDEGGQFVWDATSISLANTCLRKYYYSIILSLEPVQKSPHLIFGMHYARALETYYGLRAAGESLDEALHKVVTQTYAEAGKDQFVHNVKTLPNLIRSIVWYVDHFANEEEYGYKTYVKADGTPAVEYSFTIEFDEEFFYAGHIDRLIIDQNENPFVLDNKTTGSALGAYYFEQYRPHTQMMGYTFAGQIIFKMPIKGVIIDAAQILVGGTNFARSPIMYTNEQIEEWRKSSRDAMRRARRAFQDNDYPMNYESCGNYGGCPFRSICSATPSLRDNFIRAEFKQREKPWDPAVPR